MVVNIPTWENKKAWNRLNDNCIHQLIRNQKKKVHINNIIYLSKDGFSQKKNYEIFILLIK